MTLGEWLESRHPAPPAELAQRLRGVLGPRLDDPASSAPHRLVDAAEALLGDILDAGRASRENALDLLAVDALVTYAFEAAADAPEMLPRLAETTMRRIAALRSASA